MGNLMRKLALGMTGLAALVSASTMSNSAEIKPVSQSQETPWIADGQTEHTIVIQVDNQGLNGEPTDGVQWAFQNLPPFNYAACESPSENDFFEGFPIQYELWASPGSMSGRLTNGGPFDHVGNVGQFRTIVPIGTQPGQYTFEFHPDTGIGFSGGNTYQPATLSSANVRVIPTCYDGPTIAQDRDDDGDIDSADFAGFVDYMTGPGVPHQGCGDFDGDGDSDMRDYGLFQEAFTG